MKYAPLQLSHQQKNANRPWWPTSQVLSTSEGPQLPSKCGLSHLGNLHLAVHCKCSAVFDIGWPVCVPIEVAFFSSNNWNVGMRRLSRKCKLQRKTSYKPLSYKWKEYLVYLAISSFSQSCNLIKFIQVSWSLCFQENFFFPIQKLGCIKLSYNFQWSYYICHRQSRNTVYIMKRRKKPNTLALPYWILKRNSIAQAVRVRAHYVPQIHIPN